MKKDFAHLRDSRSIRWETLLLAGLLIVTFIPFLSETLFTTKGEPREAVVAVSMLGQGNWILPVSFGTDMPYKPPMLAWCIAFLGWLNGGVVTEFLSRLPSAVAAVAMILLTFRFFARRTSVEVAFGAALITAGSFEVFRAATICRVDMLLTFFLVASLYALYRQWEKHPAGTWAPSLAGALLMSGAVLTKGPVGMLLPCMVLFVFRMLHGERFWQTAVSLALSGLLSLIIPALWYIEAFRQGGNEFLDLVLEENFGRFTGSMSYGSHEHGILYNFTSLLSGFAPFTLLLLISLFGKPWRGVAFRWRGAGWLSRICNTDPVKLFSWLAAIVILLFYCIPKSKRSVYLLPMYPFMGYLMAVYAQRLGRIAPRTLRAFGWVLASLGALASVALLLIMTGIVAPFGSGSTKVMIETLVGEGHRLLPPAMCYLTLIGAVILAMVLARRSPRVVAIGSFSYPLVIYWMVQAAALPASMNMKSDKVIAAGIERLTDRSEPIYSFRYGKMDRFYTVNYYLGDRLLRFDAEFPSDGLLLIAPHDLPSFSTNIAPGYTFTPFASLGRSGEVKADLALYRFERKKIN